MEVRLIREAAALDLANRVKTMEDLMLPMLVDWKTHKEVQKWQEENIKKMRSAHSSGTDSSSNSSPNPNPPPTITEKAAEKANRWAEDAMNQKPKP